MCTYWCQALLQEIQPDTSFQEGCRDLDPENKGEDQGYLTVCSRLLIHGKLNVRTQSKAAQYICWGEMRSPLRKTASIFSGKSDDYPFLGNKMRERRVEEVCRLEERRMWQIMILQSGKISNQESVRGLLGRIKGSPRFLWK